MTSSSQAPEMFEITECMRHGIVSKEGYSESVRMFCLTLHFLKPRAYEYVRGKFNKNLPHQSTIRSWYRNSNIDFSPGISNSALEVLGKVGAKMKADGTPLVCNVIFDEMAIRKHVQWCNSSKMFLGYASSQFNYKEDVPPLASNVIAYMVSGINMPFRIPIGYHFITTIKGGQRSDLLLDILRRLSNCNITVSSVTFDGYAANASMCTLLGAEIEGAKKSTFHNPYDGNNIHIIYDPSHMIKLVRSKLSDYGVLYDEGHHKIEWEYIVKLEQFSRGKSIGLTHKLTKRHICWKDKPMNVRIAAETISNSVADAMEYLMRSGNAEFKYAGPTIRFIRTFDRLFDVMNTMSIKSNEPLSFKSALNPANKELIFGFLSNAREYIQSLKVISDGQLLTPILETRIKTGFRGFLCNITSIMALYREYVEEKRWMDYLPTYRFSQDHVEMWFGQIRSMDGCNDNPTAQQFTASYRKLSHQSDVSLSEASNIGVKCCSDILRIPSMLKQSRDQEQSSRTGGQPNAQNEDDILNRVIGDDREGETIDYTNDAGISFVAAVIEKRVLRCEIRCHSCVQVIEQNEKVADECCLNAISYKPCRSTFQICKLTNIAIRAHDIGRNLNKTTVLKLVNDVLRDVDFDKMYSRFFYSEHDIDHKYFLIKTIIQEFIQIKWTYVARSKTLEAHDKYIRHNLKKNTHNYGQ